MGYLTSFTESDPIAMGYLNQSVKTTASPTFAGLTLNTLTGLLKGTSGVVSAIGGTSSQFVKGDGSLDSTTYLSTVPTIDAVLTAGSTSAANNMTLTAGTLTAAHLKGSGLTATRIPYSDATGLIDAAALTFDGTNVIGTGYARFDAGIGIGAIPSSISVFNVDYTTAGGITSACVGINVLFINTKQTTLGSQGPTTYGLRFDARHLQTLTNNRTYTSGGVFGASGFARVYTNASESFNLTEFSTYGFQPIIDVSTGASSTGTLTVTNAYNFGGLIPTCGQGAGATYRGAITNMFCFYDPGMATTGVTNAWGIGINTANNYINGSLSIGKNTAPTVPLDVVGAILNTTTIEAGTGFKCGGTAAVADGTYTVGCKITPVTGADGTITTKGGIITAITQAT